MIKHIKLTSAAALLAVGLFVSNASAATVTGTLNFGGKIGVSTHAGATTLTFSSITIGTGAMAPTGSFSGDSGALAVSSLKFSGTTLDETTPYKLFSVDGITFDLTSLTATAVNGSGAIVFADGFFAEGGTDTAATLTLQALAGTGGGTVASSVAAPDGGATAVLLGAGILGLALMKRVLGSVLA